MLHKTSFLDSIVDVQRLEFIEASRNLEEKLSLSDSWKDRLALSKKEATGFAAPGGSFSQVLYEQTIAGHLPTFFQRLKNQIVVELGAGYSHFGYKLSEICGARAYLAVEPFYSDLLLTRINQISSSAEQPCPYKVVALDLLAILKLIDTGTVSIIACGIENCILPNQSYRRFAEQEIKRVLSESGIFMSFQSDLFPASLKSQENLLKCKKRGKSYRAVLFQK